MVETDRSYTLGRRAFVRLSLGAAGILVVGCSRANEQSTEASTSEGVKVNAPVSKASMTVYRDPNCGCCESWAQIAKQSGYQVLIQDEADMMAIKERYGVPPQLASCHTTLVGGLVVEGHVPVEDVERLLRERPNGIRGIAVPGMPAGSPGMEMPDGSKQAYDVVAFDGSGRTSVFASYGQA